MNLTSLIYILFALWVAGVYYLIPRDKRWVWLLVSSFVFYAMWGFAYSLHLLVFALIAYWAGLWIEQSPERKKKKRIRLLSVVLMVILLLLFKYFRFWVETIFPPTSIFYENGRLHDLSWLVPVGVSFFSLQAISYVIDVYRGSVKAERNFWQLTLYLVFFPKLISGPFERIGKLLPQLLQPKQIDFQTLVNSCVRIGWGLFKKVIIADRLGVLVRTIFDNPAAFKSPTVLLGVLAFGMQIYLDFSAYTDIALGTAKALGIDLTENFDRPYFAASVIDFWRRWHISLSQWLRDYIFLPLNFRARRARSAWVSAAMILLTFIVSGLWHDVEPNYLVWGLLHGVYQAFELGTQKWRDRVVEKFRIDRESRIHRVFQVLLTFGLVQFAWIFFRARSLDTAFQIISRIFTLNGFFSGNGWNFDLGLDAADFAMMLLGLIAFIVIECAGRKRSLITWVSQRALPIRWALYLLLLFTIVLFGYYPTSEAARFLYSQF